jgi:hypothetical protein
MAGDIRCIGGQIYNIDPGTTGVLNIASIAARREGETHR